MNAKECAWPLSQTVWQNIWNYYDDHQITLSNGQVALINIISGQPVVFFNENQPQKITRYWPIIDHKSSLKSVYLHHNTFRNKSAQWALLMLIKAGLLSILFPRRGMLNKMLVDIFTFPHLMADKYTFKSFQEILIKYRPLVSTTNSEISTICAKRSNYRPMIVDIDPLAALYYGSYMRFCRPRIPIPRKSVLGSSPWKPLWKPGLYWKPYN